MAVTTAREARGSGPPKCVIIREVYESEDAEADFELDLERALEAAAKTIVIEPTRLGDETARWIKVGNCLHKTAVLSGLGTLVTGYALPERGVIFLPMGFVSLVCAAVYGISWQFDPCCKYQVEYNPKNLETLLVYNLTSSSPVVLVRKDDSRRKILHNSVSLAALVFCAWKLYKWYVH